MFEILKNIYLYSWNIESKILYFYILHRKQIWFHQTFIKTQPGCLFAMRNMTLSKADQSIYYDSHAYLPDRQTEYPS